MHQKSSQKGIFGQKFTRKKEHSYISIIFTAKRWLLLSKRQRELDLQITKPRPDHQQQQLLCCREGMHFSLAFVPSLVLERSFFKYNQVQIMLSYTTIRLISQHLRVFCLTFKGLTLVFGRVFFWVPTMEEAISLHPGYTPWFSTRGGCFTLENLRWVVRETLPQYTKGKWYDTNPKQCTMFQANHSKLPNIWDIPNIGSLMTLTTSGQK